MYHLRRSLDARLLPRCRPVVNVAAVNVHPVPADLLNAVLAEEREAPEPPASHKKTGDEEVAFDFTYQDLGEEP